MKLQRGFTIIELLIAIVVLGVLATVAVPSFAEIFRQNQLATRANSVISAMNYARNQTINQNNNVVITPDSGTTDWSGGWTVNAGGDVRNFEGFENATFTLVHPDSVANITYQPDGSVDMNTLGDITLTLTPANCPTGKDYVREIRIKPSGQSRSSHLNCP